MLFNVCWHASFMPKVICVCCDDAFLSNPSAHSITLLGVAEENIMLWSWSRTHVSPSLKMIGKVFRQLVQFQWVWQSLASNSQDFIAKTKVRTHTTSCIQQTLATFGQRIIVLYRTLIISSEVEGCCALWTLNWLDYSFEKTVPCMWALSALIRHAGNHQYSFCVWR